MTVLDPIAYGADVGILATYATSAYGKPVRWFHWANALGCFPIIATEVIVHAWPPLLLTAAFGIIGWGGLWQTRRGQASDGTESD